MAAALVAAVLIVAGVFLDPDIDASGRELAEEYAENPGVTQLSALSFHFAFVAWAPLVFALVGIVRGRGAWLANVAALLAVLGATTLPGFLVVDFYDIAIVDTVGGDAYEDVTDRLEELPGATVLFVTGFLGHLLCLPVALFAAWRGGVLPLWTPSSSPRPRSPRKSSSRSAPACSCSRWPWSRSRTRWHAPTGGRARRLRRRRPSRRPSRAPERRDRPEGTCPGV